MSQKQKEAMWEFDKSCIKWGVLCVVLVFLLAYSLPLGTALLASILITVLFFGIWWQQRNHLKKTLEQMVQEERVQSKD